MDRNRFKPWLAERDSDERNARARKAYTALLTVTARTPDNESYRNFSNEVSTVFFAVPGMPMHRVQALAKEAVVGAKPSPKPSGRVHGYPRGTRAGRAGRGHSRGVGRGAPAGPWPRPWHGQAGRG